MKKLDNFKKSLKILANADRQEADDSEIYRSGIIAQFNLSFELAWKSIKEKLESMGVNMELKGSPRAVLKEGYVAHIIDDEEIWLDMLEKRNRVVHIYDEYEANDLKMLIFDKYIKELQNLADKLELEI